MIRTPATWLLLVAVGVPGGSFVRTIHPVATVAAPQLVTPVLAFPNPELDDTAAYQGYQTAFYRDSKDNTVQIYLQPATSRAVLVWADAANESVGFSARDERGQPTRLQWGSSSALVSDSGAERTIEFRLAAPVSTLELGWFVLGSMRIERDFVYAKRYQKPLDTGPFRVAEESLLVADVARLPDQERSRHLELLHAARLDDLRSRLTPSIRLRSMDTLTQVQIERPSLDGRNHLRLALGLDPRKVKVRLRGSAVRLETRPGSSLRFSVRVSTDAAPLTPLSRTEIFNQQFLQFLDRSRGAEDSSGGASYLRLERQVRGVELLSSQEKLMAGLPNFATYFGRDMMMTALMMRPIWSPEMPEHVIASVLRKLGPRGDVSHEEALGGQAIRETAVEYDSLLALYFRNGPSRRAGADSALSQARELLREPQRTRENYHMIDDEFQLPVLAAHYLADSTVPSDRKRGFLLQKSDSGVTRLQLLLRELNLVASLSLPYVDHPTALSLVSFPRRDSTHWRSASWRDSDAGYAGGRFAMDINVIWVPRALEAIGIIRNALTGILGADSVAVTSTQPSLQRLWNQSSLDQAIKTWRGARRHFTVTLNPAQIRRALRAKLAWLPAGDRAYWQGVLRTQGEPKDSLTFLALSLDPAGRPIGVVNTDPATELFLDGNLEADSIQAELAPILRSYPVGLFVDGLGPLVANDAYAPRAVWERFREDQYHSPRVVWGREVNLLLLGLANQIPRVPLLRDPLNRILRAVSASGLQHNELWSYEIKGGKLMPVRYGTSSDVQLWNTTNLVVQYQLSRLPQ
jgi:hypothetical protein